MTTQTENKPFNHNTIARSTSKLWNKRDLNTIVAQCAKAGHDVIKTPTTIIVGCLETDEIWLKAVNGNNNWLVRYDQKLFDENFKE